MFEKVSPAHPDKLADRIAGALVDMAYEQDVNPRIAVEVLLGHGECSIISETSVALNEQRVRDAVVRIVGATICVHYHEYPQDPLLAANQSEALRCGDNGIFKGAPTTQEQMQLSSLARLLYEHYASDGKYILDGNKLVICQSNAEDGWVSELYPDALVNPLGDWTGGPDVDCGATNRKLGSDMGDAVTGGGLHGKDLSKADVSVNIYAHLKAQNLNQPVELSCAIGDKTIDGKPFAEVVEIARDYIQKQGGFEKFAEWGLV